MKIQPLLFDSARILPFRINLVSFVHLMDYAVAKEAVLSFVGNTTMFIPIGVIFSMVFKEIAETKVVAR